MPIELPALLNAETRKPLTQIAVIARTSFGNGQYVPVGSRIFGTVRCFMRPLKDDAVVQLTLEATVGRYAMPTSVRIEDAMGKVIVDSSVFVSGKRKKVEVTLDPAKNPLPWKFTASASGDNQMTYTGTDELLFAKTAADLAAIVPMLQKEDKAGAAGP